MLHAETLQVRTPRAPQCYTQEAARRDVYAIAYNPRNPRSMAAALADLELPADMHRAVWARVEPR